MKKKRQGSWDKKERRWIKGGIPKEERERGKCWYSKQVEVHIEKGMFFNDKFISEIYVMHARTYVTDKKLLFQLKTKNTCITLVGGSI